MSPKPHSPMRILAPRLRMGQAQAAVDEFQRAVHLQADVADWHYNLAMALVLNGQPGEAADQFEAALDSSPTTPRPGPTWPRPAHGRSGPVMRSPRPRKPSSWPATE